MKRVIVFIILWILQAPYDIIAQDRPICSNVPDSLKADFSADPVSGYAPLTVHFTDMTTMNPAGWSWDFGDGTSETVQNPVHTYQSKGLYTVSLTAYNGTDLNQVIKSGYIQVGAIGIEDHQADHHLTVTPNPAKSAARVSYELTENSIVTIELVNPMGQCISTIVIAPGMKGPHDFLLNLEDFKAGVYYLKIRVNGSYQVEKILVAR